VLLRRRSGQSNSGVDGTDDEGPTDVPTGTEMMGLGLLYPFVSVRRSNGWMS
jgi:hypothetical protein